MEQQKEKKIFKNADSLRGLWDNMEGTNTDIKGVTEGEEREKGTENLSEKITAEKFPNLGKKTDVQVQEAQRVPNKIN